MSLVGVASRTRCLALLASRYQLQALTAHVVAALERGPSPISPISLDHGIATQ